MKIADLDFYLLDPHTARHEPTNSAEHSLLLRLTTATGQEGWGEARVPWRASELAPRRERILPVLAGHTVADIEELLAIDAIVPSGLQAAVEMACWDLMARSARLPLYKMWGGEYRPRVPLGVRLPVAALERTVELSRDLAARGFYTQAITATGDVEDDVALVAAVRQAVPPRVQLRLDAAGRFAAVTARELCRRLERIGLQFIIDPLETGMDGLPALVRQTTVPVAVSAPVRSPADVLALARCGVPLHVLVDIGVVGGLWPARKCAIVGAAAQLPVSLRGGAGLGVALAGVLHLAAATPNLGLAHECAAYQLHESVLRDPLVILDGTISVPQAPGLGVDVDRARAEAYQAA
ncbi:MAG TPA: enolase C-terminal domain-like protein [Pirellulales bacterium]|nr:enolase C-terminal domain-like protein [Pirellulales bacterium]